MTQRSQRARSGGVPWWSTLWKAHAAWIDSSRSAKSAAWLLVRTLWFITLSQEGVSFCKFSQHITYPQRTRHTRTRDPHPTGRHTVTPREGRTPRGPTEHHKRDTQPLRAARRRSGRSVGHPPCVGARGSRSRAGRVHGLAIIRRVRPTSCAPLLVMDLCRVSVSDRSFVHRRYAIRNTQLGSRPFAQYAFVPFNK